MLSLSLGLGMGLTRGFGGGGGRLPASLQAPRVAVDGDSIARALGVWTATQSYNTITSPVDWANSLGGGFFMPQFANKAVGGESIAQIAASFTAGMETLDPDIIVMNGGINTLDVQTSAQILAGWDDILAQRALLPTDPFLIIIPITPASVNTAYEVKRAEVNAGLLARTSAKVRVIDITGFDYTLHCYPEIGTGIRIHPNVLGAQLLGDRILTVYRQIAASFDPTLASTDPLNLIGSVGSMAGTGGSLNTATGQVATGWTVDASGAGGATVVCSKAALAGGEAAQQVAISGTFTGSSRVVNLTSGSVAVAGVAAGELVELVAKVEFASGAINVDGVGLYTFLQSSGFAYLADSFQMVTNVANDSGDPDPAGGGPSYTITLRAMSFGHPTTAPGFINMFFTAYLREGGSASTCSATFRVGKVSVRKITAAKPAKMSAPTLAAGNTTLAVTRAANPPNNGGPITSFDLRYSTDQTNWTTVAMTTNPQTITGLTNGTPVYVQTRANNAAGNGLWSASASDTPTALLYQTDFSSASGWTLNTDVTITGGSLRFTNTGGAFRTASRTLSLVNGQQYRITFEVTSADDATRVVIGGAAGGYMTGTGTKVTTITAGAGSLLEVQTPNAASDVVIDSLMVELV